MKWIILIGIIVFLVLTGCEQSERLTVKVISNTDKSYIQNCINQFDNVSLKCFNCNVKEDLQYCDYKSSIGGIKYCYC